LPRKANNSPGGGAFCKEAPFFIGNIPMNNIYHLIYKVVELNKNNKLVKDPKGVADFVLTAYY
jgi:hypothetical protein